MAMAFRGNSYWKSMLIRQLGGNRSFATSTAPKFAPTTVDAAHADNSLSSRLGLKFELAPLYVLFGMVGVGVTIGIHTMKQQLMHSPTVRVNKKRRVSVLEVEDPEVIINNSDKFVKKSFLRKVAQIQDRKPVLPDPTGANPYTRPRTAETLKTVGVNPAGQ
ncbi:hypothetical protein RGQ29_017259 [Quercus rubra]|uniref:Uncharacterized protein n=1 Tax=Quercus rubra TaxID=3512 RepID=A0AAN7FMZ7_QUERU|nr:hypothetical protein RGQ29_017259 [Quercus rubra]